VGECARITECQGELSSQPITLEVIAPAGQFSKGG
jgi:hypothetical protein